MRIIKQKVELQSLKGVIIRINYNPFDIINTLDICFLQSGKTYQKDAHKYYEYLRDTSLKIVQNFLTKNKIPCVFNESYSSSRFSILIGLNMLRQIYKTKGEKVTDTKIIKLYGEEVLSIFSDCFDLFQPKHLQEFEIVTTYGGHRRYS